MAENSVIEDISNNLGFSTLQTQIIIELMRQGGQCTAPDLYTNIKKHGSESDVKRTTIYSSLEKLVKMEIIIESISENKTKMYALVNQDPKEFINKIKKPREQAFQNFEELLEKAEKESKNKNFNPITYYSIPNKKILLEDIETLIQTSKKYILIQGNVLFLKEILKLIEKKLLHEKLDIFVQITWDPKDFDTNEIYDLYVNLLGPDRVALPHSFYKKIFPYILPTDKELNSLENKEAFIKYMRDIHFIQILTDEATLVGVHFGEIEGGGHITRDPFTTQVFYVIFFLIFESSLGKKIEPSIIKKILRDRILNNFKTLNTIKEI